MSRGLGRRLALPLVALALLVLPLLGVAHALPADTWVVAIGNNRGDADEVGLLYAEADARQVADVLRQLGGVPSDRITLVLGEQAPAVERRLAAIKAEVAAARQAGRPSALVVYYSGHSDAQALHLDGTRLPLRGLVDTVEQAQAATRLVVLDACRSGGASRVKGVSATESFALDFVEPSAVEGLAVITSSTARESSLESDRLRGSFFTHYLVAGLRGAADADGDGRVTLSEAYDHAFHETVRASGRTTQLQHPTFAMDMKGKGAVVLTRPGEAHGGLGTLRLGEPALYVVADGADERLVAELNPARAGATVTLPAGRYRVQHRRPQEYLAYDLRLASGQTVDLAALPARATRYDRLVRKGGGDRAAVHGVGALLGVRGELLAGEGATPQAVLEYGLDTRWLTPTLRLRAARSTVDDAATGAARTHTELGLGLTLQRYLDLSAFSLGVGVLAELGWHQHAFAAADVPDRTAWSGSFGALVAVERVLWGGLSLRLEAGPLATVLRTSRTEGGAEVEQGLDTVGNGWGAVGVRWRL
ncbi:MAG: caspase family protein [Myxococcales bacterium]|nr:caspase family protein [Myxococcales bacterium]